MNKIIVALSLLLGPLTPAKANPYFRVIGGEGYVKQIYTELALPFNGGNPLSLTSIPLVEHNQADGYVLIPHEDWAPLTIGVALGSAQQIVGSAAAGQKLRTALGLGPAANLSPSLKAGILGLLNATTSSGSLMNLKSMLMPNPSSSGVDVAINVGLKWVYDPFACFGGKGYVVGTFGPQFTW